MIADPSSIVQAEGHGDAGPNPAPGTESQPEWGCIGHFDCLGARGTPAPLLTGKIMDYEKMYKEALERARANYKADKEVGFLENCDMLELIFPELTESEDERIRMELVAFFKGMQDSDWHEKYWHDLEIDRILAYLEKQKEQKPAEYLDNDKVYAIMTKLTNLSYSQLIPINSDEFKKIHEITSDVRDLLDYPIEQKQEWSYEDEKMIDDIIRALTKMAESEDNILPEILPSVARKYVERLRSLRPQYHGDVTMTEAYKMGLEAGKVSSWKPSEHQMTILKAVKDYVGKGSGYWGEALGSLIEDLEKL